MNLNNFVPGATRQVTRSRFEDMIDRVSPIISSRGPANGEIGGLFMSNESLDSDRIAKLKQNVESMESDLKSTLKDMGYSAESYQIESALMAGLMSANPKTALARNLKMPKGAEEGTNIVRFSPSDGGSTVGLGIENYDERENRAAAINSVVYNLTAPLQDDFGRSWFPTLNVNPSEVGITLSAPIVTVISDFTRTATGNLPNINRRPLVQAYANEEILQNDLTRAIPVLRSSGPNQNDDKFVAGITFNDSSHGGTPIPTGYLRTNNEVDLIALAQTDEMLASGVSGYEDTLDTHIQLKGILVRMVNPADAAVFDQFEIDTTGFESSIFTYSPHGSNRRMILSLETTNLVMKPDTLPVTNAAALWLTELAASGLDIRVKLTVSGSVNIAEGKAIINGGSLDLVVARVAATGALASTVLSDAIRDKLQAATITGWIPLAYRANSNLRERCQIMDSIRENQMVTLPYRSPISAVMPATDSGANDGEVVQNLVSATNIRTTQAGITEILRVNGILKAFKAVPDASGELPGFFGLGRHYVKTTYFEDAIDFKEIVDSRVSAERQADIRAALVEQIRFYATAMYQSSEYRAGSNVLTGDPTMKPTVLVVTDQQIHQYLMVDGDVRLLGDQFDVIVTSVIDRRMRGRMFISFGLPENSRGGYNPLQFGTMLWSPELTVVMPVSRRGSHSKELMVAPRFLNYTSLPVLTSLTFTGLEDVVGKVTTYSEAAP